MCGFVNHSIVLKKQSNLFSVMNGIWIFLPNLYLLLPLVAFQTKEAQHSNGVNTGAPPHLLCPLPRRLVSLQRPITARRKENKKEEEPEHAEPESPCD